MEIGTATNAFGLSPPCCSHHAPPQPPGEAATTLLFPQATGNTPVPDIRLKPGESISVGFDGYPAPLQPALGGGGPASSATAAPPSWWGSLLVGLTQLSSSLAGLVSRLLGGGMAQPASLVAGGPTGSAASPGANQNVPTYSAAAATAATAWPAAGGAQGGAIVPGPASAPLDQAPIAAPPKPRRKKKKKKRCKKVKSFFRKAARIAIPAAAGGAIGYGIGSGWFSKLFPGGQKQER